MYEITLNFTYTLKIDWLKIIEGLYFAFLSKIKVLLKKMQYGTSWGTKTLFLHKILQQLKKGIESLPQTLII